MLRLFAAFASLSLLVSSGAVWADDAKKELEKLQGTWEIRNRKTSTYRLPLLQRG
jgi:hypothetical protein